MRQVVAIPTGQGCIAGVFKKKTQLGRFHVAVANYHVGLALMACKEVSVLFDLGQVPALKFNTAISTISNRHHSTWNNHF